MTLAQKSALAAVGVVALSLAVPLVIFEDGKAVDGCALPACCFDATGALLDDAPPCACGIDSGKGPEWRGCNSLRGATGAECVAVECAVAPGERGIRLRGESALKAQRIEAPTVEAVK